VLEEQLRAAEEEGQTHVALDLSGLSFVDSSGVSALVKARHEADERGHTLVLSQPTPQVHGVFAMLGLVQWLTYEDESEQAGHGT
jgi:anti-anti-sigma factor